ncbi:MAG: FG-GAP-like repeat-containing protein, partial [Bacteroidota bacterium]
SLKAADLNGDLSPDLVVFGANGLATAMNLGGGNFGNETVIAPNYTDVRDYHFEDIDGDGNLDIVGCAYNADQVFWLRNTGAGTFGPLQIVNSFANAANSVFAADLDNDGDMDILSTTFVDSQVAWYQNNGDEIFSSPIIIESVDFNLAMDIEAEDMDNDGDMDVIACSRTNGLNYYENLGNGTFSNAQFPFNGTNQVSQIAITDIDANGAEDIVYLMFDNNIIFWQPNLGIQGCLDPVACNFNPDAQSSNDSCCYGTCGCTNVSAVNFNSQADCEDGSCQFQVHGVVFADEDEDGFFDDNIEEFPLAFEEVVIQPLGWTAWTDDFGQFSFTLEEGNYFLEVVNSDEFPFSTTPDPLPLNIPNTDLDIEFGVSKEQPVHGICVDFYPLGEGYPCDDLVNHNICFRNEGNVPINGIIEVQIDELFQGIQEVTPIDSAVGNTFYMSFQDLAPGQMFFYDIALHTPTVDF